MNPRERDRFVQRFLSIGAISIFAFMLAMAGAKPKDRECLDYGGGAYIERSSWWGLSVTTIPLKKIGGEWHIKTPGGWEPYAVDADIPEVDEGQPVGR